MPVVDGVDLQQESSSLAAQGKLAPVPVVVGSTMEDGFIVPPNCDPASCDQQVSKARCLPVRVAAGAWR